MSIPPETPPAHAASSGPLKIRLFIDFWNFQLTLNEKARNPNFKVDWLKLPNVLVADAVRLLGNPEYRYEGTIVFTSYNPRTDEGKKYHNWATSWLDRQPGIQVKCFERRPKNPPQCPACHIPVSSCPSCNADMARTIEKGVDTAIATDMIRLAWERAYDVAILVTADSDFVPAVEFLDLRGFRVLQAGFPPHGSHLSRACWATLDLRSLYPQFER
ncbi:MAG: NYN domain-containing protein [Planctomycetes bacterium]|nr:NYN domain-containing protein [Planctomycetota bacterium]